MHADIERLEEVWDENPYKSIPMEDVDENRDVPFEVGEIVKFKGGEFKIHSIGKKFIVFKALAGTSWVKR